MALLSPLELFILFRFSAGNNASYCAFYKNACCKEQYIVRELLAMLAP